MLLRGFARPFETGLIADISSVVAQAPFRHMVTPGGHQMSVAMTNCGRAGWVTDRSGYRYDANDPEAGRPWPDMPPTFRELAAHAAAEAGFAKFSPDVCLINRYQPGARMSLHQDKDELDFGVPIVSVSLGLPAIFLFGGLKRSDKPQPLPAGAWRHRGMGRAGAAGVSRRGASRRWRACVAGPAADQSDIQEGAVILFPSPLVGEGALREAKTGEGSVSADRDPSSGATTRSRCKASASLKNGDRRSPIATFSHKGRRKKAAPRNDDATASADE